MLTTLADAYIHDLDPFLLRVTDTFGLRWYGLSYAAGFLIAWAIIRWMAKSGRSPLTPVGAGDFLFYVIAGVLIGGRLGYIVFYEPALLGFSRSFPWWDVLAINRGGMASHGGMIGVIVASIIFARRRGVPSLHLFDLTAFAACPGLALGRLANFVNGELWGRPLPEAMQASPPWWGVRYPEEFGARGEESLLTQMELALANGNDAVIQQLQPLLTAYYPSQLFQALAEGPVLLAALALVWWRPRRPGVVGAWFLVVYGVLRIATEVFRTPDADLLLGLTRGQVLSILMVVAGLVAVVICARRPVAPMGGLGPTGRRGSPAPASD